MSVEFSVSLTKAWSLLPWRFGSFHSVHASRFPSNVELGWSVWSKEMSIKNKTFEIKVDIKRIRTKRRAFGSIRKNLGSCTVFFVSGRFVLREVFGFAGVTERCSAANSAALSASRRLATSSTSYNTQDIASLWLDTFWLYQEESIFNW